MDLQLRNKVIVVCEGENNISEAIIKVLALEGAIPVIVGGNEHQNPKTAEAVKRSGGNCWHLTAELTKPEDCKKAIERVLHKFGTIDGLVNDARVTERVALKDGNYETFTASLHNNLAPYYLLAQYALPALKISKGSIVNIDFKPANTANVGTYSYSTNNGGRNALTREWAVELLKYNIRVNAILIENRHLYNNRTGNLPGLEKSKECSANISLRKRLATAEEIANVVAFLLSERSSHTTGQLIHIDESHEHLEDAFNNAKL